MADQEFVDMVREYLRKFDEYEKKLKNGDWGEEERTKFASELEIAYCGMEIWTIFITRLMLELYDRKGGK